MTKAPERPKFETVPLAKIRIDGGTQPREKIDYEKVEEYAALYREGVTLPPATLCFDGAVYWLVDGFHRYHATGKAKLQAMKAEIRTGSQDDARWMASAANKAHGLHRSNADKRKAVLIAIGARPDASDRAIAEHVGVGHQLVADARPQVDESSTSKPAGESETRIGRDGKSYKAPSRPVPSKAPSRPASKAPTRPAPSRPAKGKQEPQEPGSEPTLDTMGRPIHPKAAEALEAAGEFREIVNDLHAIKRRILALADDGIGRELRKQQIERSIKDVVTAVEFAAPATSCPMGDPCKESCKICRGSQWTTAEKFKAIPKDQRGDK